MPATAERPSLTKADVLTVTEAAELLKLPYSTVAQYCRDGKVPSLKLGRHRIVLRRKLEALLEA
jgi:excisionase family DNA binding protein